MNAARRQRKHDNHVRAGGHSLSDHLPLQVQAAVASDKRGHSTPGPVNCPACRPVSVMREITQSWRS